MITFNLHFSYENKKLFHGMKHLEPNKILIKKEMTNCGGKNLKTQWIYVYAQLIHSAVHLTLTQHCKDELYSNKNFQKNFDDWEQCIRMPSFSTIIFLCN